MYYVPFGAIQVLRNAVGGGGVIFPAGKKIYEGVWFNVISVTRGWVGVKFPGKKRCITLEWPILISIGDLIINVNEIINCYYTIHT